MTTSGTPATTGQASLTAEAKASPSVASGSPTDTKTADDSKSSAQYHDIEHVLDALVQLSKEIHVNTPIIQHHLMFSCGTCVIVDQNDTSFPGFPDQLDYPMHRIQPKSTPTSPEHHEQLVAEHFAEIMANNKTVWDSQRSNTWVARGFAKLIADG